VKPVKRITAGEPTINKMAFFTWAGHNLVHLHFSGYNLDHPPLP